MRSNSVESYIGVFRAAFGEETLRVLAADPYRFEKWLKGLQQESKWENATYNRYIQHGRAMFNWAKRRKIVAENPFDVLNTLPELNKRDIRITAEQERKLLEACDLLDEPPKPKLIKATPETVTAVRLRAEAGELQRDIAASVGLSRALVSQIINGHVWKPNVRQLGIGREMKRRLIVALDLGLREGEMLLLQVKHIDFTDWRVDLPATITKAQKGQHVFAGTDRLRAVLNERRFLGPDGYVFGKENGRCVGSFDKSWHRLFKLAGLPVGRKNGYVWHDLRHEYGSVLIEHGATIQEAKEMMRHADIRTTARYLTASEDRLRELAAGMGKRLT